MGKSDVSKDSRSEWLPPADADTDAAGFGLAERDHGAEGKGHPAISPGRTDPEPPLEDLLSQVDAAERRARDAQLRAEAAERPKRMTSGEVPAAPPGSNNFSFEFPRLADQVEQQLTSVEEIVETADREVRRLVGPPPDWHRPSVAAAPVHGPATTPGDSPGQPETQRLDVNEIGFEQLRELGLDVVQAARLLAKRDEEGGYGSLTDLEQLAGFPPELVERLKRVLSTGD